MKSYFLVFYSLRRPIMNNLQEKVIRAMVDMYGFYSIEELSEMTEISISSIKRSLKDITTFKWKPRIFLLQKELHFRYLIQLSGKLHSSIIFRGIMC